ncbi:hypothetical protein FJV48_20520 [Citrobacter freundii]|nr:hypothetical protein [Citrobacter freundii]
MLRNTLRLFLLAIGPGARKHPCKARPEPASMLALPALRKHVGNFQPGAGIVKGVAENALYTFTGIRVSEKQ